MALQTLFDRSPVLPVDAAISLARYLHTIRQTQKQAIASSKSGDSSRAALLHIRVLQLVCKTLPSHPDYALPENAAVIHELRAVAHISFRDVEVLANQLATTPQATTASRKSRVTRRPRRKLVVSTSLFDLFERIAADRSAHGEVTMALLAARVDSVTSNAEHDEIIALIVPPQTYGNDWNDMRYERDVTHLLEIKELVVVGLISLVPRERHSSLPLRAVKTLSIIQAQFPSATAIVITPRDTTSRLAFFSLSEKAVPYVWSVNGEIQEDVIPQGVDGEGELIFVPARHVEQREDATPQFKLYDLRPLAAVRDETSRNGVERSS